MTQFDQDIGLNRTGTGSFDAVISDTWNVHIGPNGGYIAALILNGIKRELGDKGSQTRSITYHFLSASKPGPAKLGVTVEKFGRTLSTATAKLMQGDRTIALAIATFGEARPFFEFRDFNAPIIKPPEAITSAERMGPGMQGHVPFRDHYDQRLAIGPTPPSTTDKGQVGGWTRFEEHRTFDDLAIVAISDSWFPSMMAKNLPERLHAPTVDHSVHFMTSLPYKGMSISDFVLVEFKTEVASEGYLIEDGCMWAPDGTLLARSRQLAIMMKD
ncbi:MAG: thioesterase family protein [Pseudomonadales bacterium]